MEKGTKKERRSYGEGAKNGARDERAGVRICWRPVLLRRSVGKEQPEARPLLPGAYAAAPLVQLHNSAHDR